MRYVFIINPVSGGYKEAQSYIAHLKKLCNDKNLNYEIYKTQYRGHATKIAKQEASKGKNVRIYGFGGDGTLHEILEGSLGFENAEIGIFSFGSGNDYVKNFTNSSDLFKNIEAQINGEAKLVDVIKSEDGQYALNQCAIGIDAKVAMHMEEFKNKPFVSGPMAYNLSLAKCVFSHFGVPMQITLDENTKINGEFMLALIANGKYYGGGYKGAPEAKPDDGLLDVILIKKISRLKFAKIVNIYKNGEHLNSEKFKDILVYKRCKKFTVQTNSRTVITFDGECSKVKSASLKVIPSAIKFIVPQIKTNSNVKKDFAAISLS